MTKETITKKENEELYKDFNRTLEAYAVLNPDKYSSLERICYCDLINDVIYPFLRDLEREVTYTHEQLLEQSHATWIDLYKNGDIDRYCRKV
jgi:hypothetical protein